MRVTLNGKVVQRLDLDVGAVTPATTARYALTSDASDDIVTTLVDTSLLVEGINVLAVELHQAGSSRADLLWGADLRGY